MMQSEPTIPVTWAWVGGGALLAIGIAWGALTVRVKAMEKTVDGLGERFDLLLKELGKLRELLAGLRP